MKKGMRGRWLAWLILALSVCTMVVSGIKWWQIEQRYRQADDFYARLQGLTDGVNSPGFIPKEGSENVYGKVDFASLQALNADIVAWLYCQDTVIDYPVLRADDYDFYLHHLPDGTYNDNGALFIDYNNAADFSGALTIIYGHHTKNGAMFGSLEGYKRQDYYESHPDVLLYTEQGVYRIELLYGCVIGVGQWRQRGFMFAEHRAELLAYAAENTTFVCGDAGGLTGVDGLEVGALADEDRIVVLSTCSYEFDGARYVVIGVLRQID